MSTGTTVTCKTTKIIISAAQKVSEKDKGDVVSDNGRRMDAGRLSDWRIVAGSTHFVFIGFVGCGCGCDGLTWSIIGFVGCAIG